HTLIGRYTDRGDHVRDSIFSLVFLRRNKEISLGKWIKFLLLEIYLGEQLLEMISTTAAYNEDDQYEKTGQVQFGDSLNGWSKPLVYYIPSTMINKWLCSSILELLEYKYVAHYQLLTSRDNVADTENCYGLNHDNIHQLTELKLAYNSIWVTMNIIVDVVVYLVTKNLSATLATGAFIEFIRRFKW
ncbi:hypothetical protein, partial [Vibrio anguillarum]|uniref:hypothetical protein n=2 Tax=Vibrio anguillarum TaxID=55601 RepID=UPI000E2961DC